MSDRFLRLQNMQTAVRSLVQGYPLAAAIVLVIAVSLPVFLSLSLLNRAPIGLPTATTAPTFAAALQAERTTTRPPDDRLPTDAPPPTGKPTSGATAVPTAPLTAIPAESFTPTPAATPTASATPTSTDVYVPISVFPSDIEIGAPDNVTAHIVLFPARIRAGPSTQDDVLARLGQGVRVTLGGITANATWVLLKVTDPRTDQDAKEGWMAVELIEIDGDLTTLLSYTDEGIRIRPFGSRPPGIVVKLTFTPVAITGPVTDTVTPTPVATPTPAATPTPTATATPAATANAHRNGNAHRNRNACGNANAHRNGHACGNGNAYRDSNAHGDRNAHTNSNGSSRTGKVGVRS